MKTLKKALTLMAFTYALIFMMFIGLVATTTMLLNATH